MQIAALTTPTEIEPPGLRVPATRPLPLPIQVPFFPGYDMDAKYGTTRVGGDFFDVVADSRAALLLLTDIAGERHNTVDLAVQVQDAFRHSAHSILAAETNIDTAEAIGFALRSINLALMSAAQGVRCAPTMLARIDAATGRVAYVNAGAPAAILGGLRSYRLLESHGLPLGLFNELAHETQWAHLDRGGWLVTVSKGVVESRNRTHEFGIAGVEQVISMGPHASARGVNDQVLRSAIEFAYGQGYASTMLGQARHFSGASQMELEQDMTAFTVLRRN